MKVKIAYGKILMRGLKIPQTCCSCTGNTPYKYDELLCLEEKGRTLYTLRFKFPYCYTCYEKLRKTKLFKDRIRAVQVSNVKKAKYGKFFRKQTLPYVEFDFKNDHYGLLFKKANKDSLFEKVLAELNLKET